MWLQSKIAIRTNKFTANHTRRRTQKIICFNPPFSLNGKANVAKIFLQLKDTHFPSANKLYT